MITTSETCHHLMLNSSWDRLHLMQHQKIEKKEEEEHLDY